MHWRLSVKIRSREYKIGGWFCNSSINTTNFHTRVDSLETSARPPMKLQPSPMNNNMYEVSAVYRIITKVSDK